jgi:microcompartment protein CcmK/EutM
MILGRVCGRLVSTIHHPAMDARRLLVVERIHPDGSATGADLIAVDVVGAGAGETVIVLDEGNGARQLLGGRNLPVRSVVVGIVDAVESWSTNANPERR